MTTSSSNGRGQRPELLRALSNILGMFIILGTAWFMWPASLGGRTQFIIVQGTSMEPTYHSGDLLYARKSGNYGPEDIAVYTIPEGEPGAGALVVHRIVSEEASGKYRLKGDNRESLDDAQPSRADFVAKPVMNLGQLPTRLIILTPFFLSIVLGAAVAWFLWPTKVTKEHSPEPEIQPGSEPGPEPDDDGAPTEVVSGLASRQEQTLTSVG